MSNQQASRQSARGSGAAQPQQQQQQGSGAKTYSAEALQQLVDQAASFNTFSLPDASESGVAIRSQGNGGQSSGGQGNGGQGYNSQGYNSQGYSGQGNRRQGNDGQGNGGQGNGGQVNNGDVIGFRVCEDLHRFAVNVRAPTDTDGLKATNVVGESYGTFRHRWMLAPDNFVASPGREPPPTALDMSRSQRFIMLESVCRFGDSGDGFRGFGAGKTFIMNNGGQRQLLAATVGTILEGFGSFKGHEHGTYVHCGSLSAERGFTGNMLLRVMDAQGTLRTTGRLSAPKEQSFPERDITYIVLRGQAVESDPVTPRIGNDGQLRGLTVVQGLRLVSLSSDSGRGGARSSTRVGQMVGQITAHVDFNPAAPGGTALNPIPFTTFDELTFTDNRGRRIGGFEADSSEGRVFSIAVAGQGGIRFGGVGQILSGTGPFQGMNGLMTDNSVVIFSPHVSASLYVLRVHDPDGRFRAGVNGD